MKIQAIRESDSRSMSYSTCCGTECVETELTKRRVNRQPTFVYADLIASV